MHEDKNYNGTEFTCVPKKRARNLGKLDMANDIESMKITCGTGYVYFQIEQTGSIFRICSVIRGSLPVRQYSGVACLLWKNVPPYINTVLAFPSPIPSCSKNDRTVEYRPFVDDFSQAQA
jgi:hypothetical protein